MKYIPIIFAILCCTNESRPTIESQLRTSLLVKGWYNSGGKDSNEEFMVTELKVENVGNNRLKFWVFSCPTMINIDKKSKNFDYLPNQCDNFRPQLIELKQNQSMYIPVLLKMINRDAEEESINLGFVLIYEDQYNPGNTMGNQMNTLMKIKEKGDQTVWTGNVDYYSAEQYLIK
jgi:hypothetical protein